MADQAIASVNRGEAAYARLVEIERRLFGWMLAGEFNAIDHAQGAREMADAFYQPHDRIVAAIFAAFDAKQDASPAAIALRLGHDKNLADLGGLEYLRTWSFAAPALVSEDDARRQIERAISDYANLAGKITLEENAEDALASLKAGSTDALERIAELSRSAEILASARNITAAPFLCRPAEDIPPRQWLHGHHAIRGFTSATLASGGTGKTALALTETLALVSGRPLLREKVQRHAAWYLGLEDPLVEYERRIAAAMLLHKLEPKDLAGGLFINSGRGGEFVIAGQDRGGLYINRPVISALTRIIRQNNIALVTIDPFVACHTVAEADNTAIAAVAREWAHIADQTGCAIELVHHVRKGMGSTQEASADDARGASAFVNATRSARMLVPMTREEAERSEIGPDDRRRFFQVTNAKANLWLHTDDGVWREMQSITLRNGNGGPDDLVGAVMAWDLPDAAEMADPAARAAILEKISMGEWRLDPQASAWAGKAVAEVLALDVSDRAAKQSIKRTLDAWLQQGVIQVEKRLDPTTRKPRAFVKVGHG